jgi:hypothetical protein
MLPAYCEYRPPAGLEPLVACLREIAPPTDVVLRPAAVGAILGLPASGVRDQDVTLALVWGEQGTKLQGALARVVYVAAELGVSGRQLHRRVLAAVGYGPKMLARVARLWRLVALPEDALASCRPAAAVKTGNWEASNWLTSLAS